MWNQYKYYIISISLAIAALGGVYFYQNIGKKEAGQSQESSQESINQTPSSTADNSTTGQQSTPNSGDEEKLVIPKLSIEAPIFKNIDGNDKQLYLKTLENGVAHLAGTPLPGEDGNSVLFGHSSYFNDRPGNYKNIFAKNNDLGVGDVLTVVTGSQQLNYKVTGKKIVESKDLSVLAQTAGKKILTVITCWPVGTIDKRLVLAAELN